MKKISWLIFCVLLSGCVHESPSVISRQQTQVDYRVIATHVVQQGETGVTIAKRYYQSQYSDIALQRMMDCNLKLILSESTGSIQPGMKLQIPALPDKED
jgi:hypothetical protein